jgi:hypothetical protein
VLRCRGRTDTASSTRVFRGLPGVSKGYNRFMEKKIFWMIFLVLGTVADIVLPLWIGLLATIPILFFSWWVAYRSDWF